MTGLELIAYPIVAVLLVLAGYRAGHHDGRRGRVSRARFFEPTTGADTPRPLSFSPPRPRENPRSGPERPGSHRKGRRAGR